METSLPGTFETGNMPQGTEYGLLHDHLKLQVYDATMSAMMSMKGFHLLLDNFNARSAK